MRGRMIAAAALGLVGCGRVGFDARSGVDGGADAPDSAPGAHDTVYAFANQTCALHEGALWCWGENNAGALGDGTLNDRETPVRVVLPMGTITDVALGELHGCALVDGELWCWGEAFDPTPKVVQLSGGVSDVTAGRGYTCAIADQTYCWGNGSNGQLGDGTLSDRAVPTPVATAQTFVAIDGGDDHTCALDTTSHAWCWGHNDDGALGFGSTTTENRPNPMQVLDPVNALPQIAGWHACALAAGTLRCWGRNNEGELGNSTQTSIGMPAPVPGLTAVTAFATSGNGADFDANCAIQFGAVLCWGMGLNGRLGTGNADIALVPMPVVGLPDEPAVDVALGYNHTCTVLESNALYCWGSNSNGQLALPRTQPGSFAPTRVVFPAD